VEEAKLALIELHEKEAREIADRLHKETDEERELQEMERQRNKRWSWSRSSTAGL
jgi:K+/H+ antiporter YhaU regulatory subunit KhtT